MSKFKGLENKILKMKYIDGMKLERIAEELNYSPSYINLKHAEIMRRIKFVERLKSEE
ncbi:transcriptional regulator [Bacillus pseudomycoides]|nr:transcriptional regulator [Bacillus pseudomycoides]PHC93846.1 transcriptional regulator [Bacillus pseudomycoides]